MVYGLVFAAGVLCGAGMTVLSAILYLTVDLEDKD